MKSVLKSGALSAGLFAINFAKQAIEKAAKQKRLQCEQGSIAHRGI